MRFKVPGPLEIKTDDGPLVVTGRRPRALLVALLLKPRVVVSTARLVDALWEELRLGCLEGRVELLLPCPGWQALIVRATAPWSAATARTRPPE